MCSKNIALALSAIGTVTVLGARTPRPDLNLPLTFIENRGQKDSHVRYYAQGNGYAFYLTRDGIVLSFREGSTALRFLGANPRVRIEGGEPAAGGINYFHGSDPAQWRTGLRHYGEIVYRDLWPGIDLRLRQQRATLKYEFHVRAGASPADIRLAYRGAHGLSLDDGGTLLVRTALGDMRDAAPVSYQEIDGVRVLVESRYRIAHGIYGFAVGAGYDRTRELIIDPGLDFSTFLGGSSSEGGAGMAVDSAGNTYIVGTTQSSDFPTTAGAFRRTGAASGFSDVFVTKLNPTGTALVYSTFIGGSNFDWGRAIAVDAAGNAYVTGQTKSSNFPVTANAFDRTFNIPNCPRCGVDNYDAFVLKLNPTGSALVYSTYLGGAQDIDDALGIAVDSSGSAYVTGETGSADFPVTRGAFQTTRNGEYDAYVTKLNPAGSALVYSTFIGGSLVDFGVRIAVDSANNAYVLGNTRSPDFPTTPGAFDTTANGAFDIFVFKLNATGSGLIYSTYLGGSNMEGAGGLAIDSAGNAYVSGGTLSLDYPTTPGALRTTTDGNDGFVTKLNPTGSALVYSTYFGGSGTDNVSAIALDASGNAFLAGGTGSTDFPTTPGAIQSVFSGGTVDAFVAEIDATGSSVLLGTYLGGSNSDFANDLKLGPSGAIFVTGQTSSTDFPTTAGAFQRTLNGTTSSFAPDAFVARISPGGTPPAPTLSSEAVSPATIVGGSTVTGTVTLTGAAQAAGAGVSLSSSSPSVAGVPTSVNVAAGATSATFNITTSAVAANTAVTVTATYNGVTRNATLTVTPPPSLQSISLSPSSVVGGNSAQATITLTTTAPAGGAVVSLASSNTAAATVPANITVPAGASSTTVAVSTVSVAASTSSTISGSYGGASASAVLTITPPITLTTFVLNPATVQGRDQSIGTVTISSPAPAGGFPVSVTTSDGTIAAGPGTNSVTVPQGNTSAGFAIGTNSVTTPTQVTFTASGGGVTKTAVLTVTPPQTATLTVTATGRSGERITSSPAGISVAVGSTGSASFNLGTTVTLTVSNGRNANWSGGCTGSSNHCTLSLNANGSVTANVQ
jgi:hypothetical protein